MTAPPAGTTAAATGRFSGNVLGMAGMLVAMGCFVLNDGFVKLVGPKLPVGQLITIRGLFALALALPVAWSFGVLRHAPRLLKPLIALRALCEMFATGLFLLGLIHSKFAEANAVLQFTPLAMTAAAALFLGERVGWRRWLAAFAGLVGVLLIIKPGTEAFSWYSLPLIGSVLCVAVRDLVTRRISSDIPTLLITVLSAASVSAFGMVVSIFQPWQAASPIDVLHLFCAAVFLAVGYFVITMALRSGEISAVAPFRYSVVVYAIVIGYFFWGEVPDRWALLGVAIVTAAGIYTLRRERRLRIVEHSVPIAVPDRS